MKSDEFLIKKGFVVDPTKEYALKKDDALKYIKLLKEEGKIILGGDVYRVDNKSGKLIPTYDSWYLSDNELEVENGYEISKRYIEDYLENKNIEDSTYFVIVYNTYDKIKNRQGSVLER